MAPVGSVLPPAHPEARWENLNDKAVIILISTTTERIYEESIWTGLDSCRLLELAIGIFGIWLTSDNYLIFFLKIA